MRSGVRTNFIRPNMPQTRGGTPDQAALLKHIHTSFTSVTRVILLSVTHPA